MTDKEISKAKHELKMQWKKLAEDIVQAKTGAKVGNVVNYGNGGMAVLVSINPANIHLNTITCKVQKLHRRTYIDIDYRIIKSVAHESYTAWYKWWREKISANKQKSK